MIIVDSKLFNSDLIYMTKIERATFDKLLESRVVSIFRISVCKNCKRDILKGKEYCSIECYNAKEQIDEKKTNEEYDEW